MITRLARPSPRQRARYHLPAMIQANVRGSLHVPEEGRASRWVYLITRTRYGPGRYTGSYRKTPVSVSGIRKTMQGSRGQRLSDLRILHQPKSGDL